MIHQAGSSCPCPLCSYAGTRLPKINARTQNASRNSSKDAFVAGSVCPGQLSLSFPNSILPYQGRYIRRDQPTIQLIKCCGRLPHVCFGHAVLPVSVVFDAIRPLHLRAHMKQGYCEMALTSAWAYSSIVTYNGSCACAMAVRLPSSVPWSAAPSKNPPHKKR